jgi:hypothetical protein
MALCVVSLTAETALVSLDDAAGVYMFKLLHYSTWAAASLNNITDLQLARNTIVAASAGRFMKVGVFGSYLFVTCMQKYMVSVYARCLQGPSIWTELLTLSLPPYEPVAFAREVFLSVLSDRVIVVANSISGSYTAQMRWIEVLTPCSSRGLSSAPSFPAAEASSHLASSSRTIHRSPSSSQHDRSTPNLQPSNHPSPARVSTSSEVRPTPEASVMSRPGSTGVLFVVCGFFAVAVVVASASLVYAQRLKRQRRSSVHHQATSATELLKGCSEVELPTLGTQDNRPGLADAGVDEITFVHHRVAVDRGDDTTLADVVCSGKLAIAIACVS